MNLTGYCRGNWCSKPERVGDPVFSRTDAEGTEAMSTDTGSLTSEREKTKQRVAKLLNMTCDRGASESEAMMAAGKAAELMAHCDIEASELSLRSVRAIKKASLMRRYGRRIIANHCGYYVAQLCDCMFWRTDDHFVFFGFPEDAEIAAYLFDLVSYGILADVDIYKATPGYRAEAKSTRVGGRALVGTFIAGMEDRICDRLAASRDEKARTIQEATGRSLVVVKAEQIKGDFEATGIILGRARSSRSVLWSEAAYGSGKAAGDNLSLSPGVRSGRVAGLLK
jgi:hypothetical protein